MAPRSAKDGVKKAREEMYRGLVVEAAEQVFAERGFEDARIQEIALGAGISLGTLYSVFPGKWEVYAAVHEARGAELLAAAMEAVVDREMGALGLILEGVKTYVDFLVGHPSYLQMHLREGYSWAASGEYKSGEQTRAWETGIELTAGLLAQGQAEGVIVQGSPPLLAKMMAAIQQVQIADWAERGMSEPSALLVENIQVQFRRSFVVS